MGRKRKPRKTLENVTITGVADKGRSVGRDAEGKVVFVENTVPGDVVDVKLSRQKEGWSEGFPVHFHKLSEDRIEAFCQHFGVCGGCKWQHLAYETQLQHKESVVFNAIKRIGKIGDAEYLPIVPSKNTKYYRNKLEFTFSNRRWLTEEDIGTGASNQEDVLGFHRPRAFDKIVDIEHCYLQKDPSNEIRNTLRGIAKEQNLKFFDLKEKTGDVRHVLIRTTSLDQVMIIVSFGNNDKEMIAKFLDEVNNRVEGISSLHYCVNTKVNDFILDLDILCYSGQGYIEEMLGDVKFRIGAKSFFQTNTDQAVILFDKVCEFAEFDGTENVYDLYTGLGSIALYIANRVKQVVGIEEIEAAIVDAKANAERNEMNNAVFYAGAVRNILSTEFSEKHGKPDVVITDPPRAGMHKKVVRLLLELESPKIVYVSCNPATQARDLRLLTAKYSVTKIQPVDMFPHTHHIETVAMLYLKPKEEWVMPDEASFKKQENVSNAMNYLPE